MHSFHQDKYESECDFQEIYKLNSRIIKVVEMIKDSNLFKLIQLNSLENEIAQQKSAEKHEINNITTDLRKIIKDIKVRKSWTSQPRKRNK